MNHIDTYTWKEINETPQVFEKIREKNADVIKTLTRVIKASGITNFVAAARGSSNNAIVYFKYLLEVMSNYTVGLSAPSIVTLYKGKIDYSKSIIIGCSQSGLAEDVLEVIKKGNNQGAITIAVTNDPTSPIAKEAKYNLFCCAGEEKSAIATKTFSAEMYILLWLASELANIKENDFYLKNLGSELNRIMPDIDSVTDVYAERFKGINNGYILSRGLTYAIALEASLKLQETCYMQIRGYSGSEFLHGPIASVNKDTLIIVYCGKFEGDFEIQSAIRADQIKTIQRMLKLKAPVLLVTNDNLLTGRFTECNDVLINLSVPEEFSIFAFAIFSQMLACKISCLIGNNPDTPRLLEKNVVL